MTADSISIKRALISVSDKTNIVEFAQGLAQLNIEIISTGGTSKLLRDANITVKDVSELTHFPEMMDGRVKTLHPKIHGGILGRRDQHQEIAKQHGIQWIDLVIVNLYPFAKTISQPQVDFATAIENIDIGGPAMIRSAAKNMEWVGVVVDALDYGFIIEKLRTDNGLNLSTRKHLAAKAFKHTADYDATIANYFTTQSQSALYDEKGIGGLDGDNILLTLKKHSDLRYGENPHQNATAYQLSASEGILQAKQYQGKQLSYNNLVDADAAVNCVQEFSAPACVIVKHANPCGAAVANDVIDAFQLAFAADSQSAFGGIIALNRNCNKELAEIINQMFFEVLIAPSYDAAALEIFSSKPNLRILALTKTLTVKSEYKFINGGVLIQDRDWSALVQEKLQIVTNTTPSPEQIAAMEFAWPVLKYIKSNGILIANKNHTIGIGAGQVSRIDAVELAIRKAHNNLENAVIASDAFFPFRDSIDRIAAAGIRAVIQPGGSLRDPEVIAACNEHNIAMVMTGLRCFKH